MFTGIVEEIGTILGVQPVGGGIHLHISASRSIKELRVNDSISVNGVCQTVIWKDENSFKVEAVEETLKKTSMGKLSSKSEVNLELPLRINERLGGHLVLGHVDTTGKIMEIVPRESSWMFSVTVSNHYTQYLIPTGSIAIDGVSLTIAELNQHKFTVSIIPHTMEHTIFKHYRPGSVVNIEFDLVGKYIERIYLHSSPDNLKKMKLNEKDLRETGY